MITREQAVAALKECHDPEIGLDVWTLGFIRQLDIDGAGESAHLVMTLTTPMCPFSSQLVGAVKERLQQLGLKRVEVELSFDPPWEPSEEVRLLLGT